MYFINKLVFFVFIIHFFLNPLASATEKCIHSTIRWLEFGKVRQVSANYFTNKDKTSLISCNCKNKKCRAYKFFIKLKKKDLFSEVGNPTFKLCRALHGEPKIVKFLVEKKWYKLDRCFFKRDASYMDGGSLWEAYFNSF